LSRGSFSSISSFALFVALEGEQLNMVADVQRKLVQSTFAAIVPIADDAAMLFYQRLFEIAPELRPMFRGDMTEQRKN
jgi:hypothetical protein